MNLNFTAKSYYVFLFLLPLFFLSGISDPVLLPRQLFLSFFTGLLFLIFWRNSKDDSDSIKLDAAPVAMILYFLIAAAVSVSTATIVSESLYFLSKLWITISFLLLTITFLKKKTVTISQIVQAVILFGCVAIVAAVADIVFKTENISQLQYSIHNVSGNFANKNLLASILFLCLPFFMIGCQTKKTWLVSILALLFAISILLIIRTRTALIATLVFFGILVFFYLRNFLKRKFLLGSAIIFGLLITGFFKFRWYEVVAKPESSGFVKQYAVRLFNANTFKTRILFWQNSLEMVKEFPFGVGLGNWQIYFPKYGLEKFDSYNMVNGIDTLQRPHNDFLWVLCETGILGFTAFIAVFAIIIYQCLSLIKIATDKYERQTFVYLFSAVIGFMVIAFFDFPMERMEHQIVLMLLFAIVIYQYSLKNKNSFTLPLKKFVLLFFIGFGCCFSFAIAYHRLQSERQVYSLNQSRQEKNVDEVLLFAQNAESNLYKIDSKTIPLQWYMGTAYFAQGQFSESETCFKSAYKLTPYNIHVINNLASCYEINGKGADAIAMYLKALQISPHFEEARLNLAAVYFNNKQFDKAFQTINLCALETRDPKYKMFLPPILKAKAGLILESVNFPVSTETKMAFTNMQDYSQLYVESKKNKSTFEQQIINQLKQ